MMGPVPYTVDLYRLRQVTNDKGARVLSDKVSRMLETFPALLRFEMGEINFGPSREEIAYNELTARRIEELGTVIYDHMKAQAQEAYKDVNTLYEAILTYRKNNRLVRFFLSSEGLTLPDGISKQDVIAGVVSLPTTDIALPSGTVTEKYSDDIIVEYCEFNRRWKKKGYDHLPIGDNYVYVFFDTPLNGYTQRLTSLQNTLSYNEKIILVKVKYDAVFNKWMRDTGMEGNVKFVNLSDYEKKLTVTEKLIRKTRGQIFNYDSKACSEVNSEHWEKVEDEIDFSETIYWIPIYCFKPQVGGSPISFNAFNYLLRKARDCDSIAFTQDDLDNVIGVKNTANCKAIKEFEKTDNCINVITYLKDQIMKYYDQGKIMQTLADADHYSSYSGTHNIFSSTYGYDKFKKALQEQSDSSNPIWGFVKKFETMRNQFRSRDKVDLDLLSALKNISSTTKLDEYPKPTYNLVELDKEFVERYPLIEFANCSAYGSSWRDSNNECDRFISSLINYISTIDSSTINTQSIAS